MFNDMNNDNLEYALDVIDFYNEKDPETLEKVLAKRSGVNLSKFKDLYDKFIEMHENEELFKSVKAKTRGSVLEEIIKILTVQTNAFDVLENVTNDTNEFDLIIKPSETAKKAYNSYPHIIYQPIICECKNYNKAIDVTWIGKFYSLLSLSNIKIGVVFSYEGITGDKEWDGALGLVKKIYLKEKIAILSIDKKDLMKVVNGERLYNIFDKKLEELRFLTKIEDSKIVHPSNNRVEEILSKINEEIKKTGRNKKAGR